VALAARAQQPTMPVIGTRPLTGLRDAHRANLSLHRNFRARQPQILVTDAGQKE
jgi:hypothetical protein